MLRVDFLSHGQQLVTSASDGLVKLWNIKEEECVKTLDNHEDKVSILSLSVTRDHPLIFPRGLSCRSGLSHIHPTSPPFSPPAPIPSSLSGTTPHSSNNPRQTLISSRPSRSNRISSTMSLSKTIVAPSYSHSP